MSFLDLVLHHLLSNATQKPTWPKVKTNSLTRARSSCSILTMRNLETLALEWRLACVRKSSTVDSKSSNQLYAERTKKRQSQRNEEKDP